MTDFDNLWIDQCCRVCSCSANRWPACGLTVGPAGASLPNKLTAAYQIRPMRGGCFVMKRPRKCHGLVVLMCSVKSLSIEIDFPGTVRANLHKYVLTGKPVST